jgi:hypothetical protein
VLNAGSQEQSGERLNAWTRSTGNKMMLAMLDCVRGLAGCGLFLLGVASLIGLELAGPRRWQKGIMSFGIGASFGGVLTIFSLAGWDSEYLQFAVMVLRKLQIQRILPASFALADVGRIGVFISGMAFGGLMGWSYQRGKEKKDETV